MICSIWLQYHILGFADSGFPKKKIFTYSIPQSWWIFHWENKPNHRLNKQGDTALQGEVLARTNPYEIAKG